MQQRPFAGAFLIPLTTFIRPSYVLIVAPLMCATYTPSCRFGRLFSRRCLGAGIGVSLFLAVNYLLWGDPFTTVYGRLPGFRNGEMVILPHPIGFDLATLKSDWPSKLWGSKGILPFMSCVVFLPWVLGNLRHQRERWFQSVCLLSALLYTTYIFSYPMWMVTGTGNRFLLAPCFLCVPSCIAWISRKLPKEEKVSISPSA